MATNYVEIKIKASDTAKPDLTGLKAQLDEIGRKTETAQVSVDDADATAKLLNINAKLAALNKRVANPRISVTGAAKAQAEIFALGREMDKLGGKSADLKTRLTALGGAAAAAAGFATFSKDASMATKVMSGFSLATGLLEAPMSGLLVGVGGLASGLVAAGAGLGAFGLVAKSNFTTASTAAKQVQTAQIAYNAAIKAGAKQSTAYVAEQKAIGIAYAQLSPAQIALSKSLNNAQNSWQSFVQSNTTGVSKILNQGIGLLPQVFKSMQVFMAPTEKALGGLIGQLGKGLGSSGFKSFIDMLAKNSGPAITKIGQSIGHIVVGLGGIIKAFMPFAQIMLSGLDKITAKFAHWGTTLTQHSGFQSLTAMAKQDMPLVIQIVKNLGGAIKNLGSSMTGLSTFANSKMLLQLALPLSQLVNYLSRANPGLLRMGLYMLAAGQAGSKLKALFGEGGAIGGMVKTVKDGATAFGHLKAGFTDAETAASAASGVWGTFGGKLSTVVSGIKEWGIWSKIASAATKIWTGIQAAFDLVMDANPIGLVVIAIAALVAGVILAYTHFKAFRDVVDRVMRDIWHAVEAAFSWIRDHWKLLLGILTGPIGAAAIFIISHWHQILAGAQRMVGDVTGWFRRLPGMILSAVGNLGSLLLQGGVNLVMGLVHGIESMASAPFNAVKSIVSGIRSLLPFSPAKKGPLSGAGSPDIAGRKIATMLAAGMMSGAPVAAGAAERLAGAASIPVGGVRRGGGYGGYGGGQPLQIIIEAGHGTSGLEQLFWTWFKNGVRVRGGDPRIVDRKVVFR